MIVVKGNLLINKSRREPLLSTILLDLIQKRTSPVYDPLGSNPEEIKLVVAYADLKDLDVIEAIVIENDVTVQDIDVNEDIYVTGNIAYIEEGDR